MQSRRRMLALGTVLLLVTATVPAWADVVPHGLKIEKILDNSAELGDLAQSPTNELWMLERGGTIRVLVAGIEDANLAVTVSTSCDSGLLDVAFAPDYRASGRAFIYYVDTTGKARVDEVFRTDTGLQLGSMILDLGSTAGGCQPGGGLAVGPDGKLYVSVGDLENPNNGQDDLVLAGKVLRAELDGSVPVDNASGTLVFAKGFRDGRDLAINPSTSRVNGTVYVTDRGKGTGTGQSVYDESNAVAEGGNYGWDDADGPDPGYDDPLTYDYDMAPMALEVFSGTALGGMNGSLVYACVNEDDIRQAHLTGSEMDQLDNEVVFYDPAGDRDGTPDAGCPQQMNALAEGGEGWLYGANIGANPGIWRVWRDDPGPREVSAPGSPFALTVAKSGATLEIGWENLGSLDTGRPGRHANQRTTVYRIWEGTLPIGGSYDHLALLDTDGIADGPARLTATVPPGGGNHYYLVAAHGDNMEGTLGAGRPAAEDYCDTIGWGTAVNKCAQKWVSPVDGSELALVDYNPHSATFMQALTLDDFRGKVIRMDISANDCSWCDVQADLFNGLDLQYGDRDVQTVTVFMLSFVGWTAIADPAQCALLIEQWANRNNEPGPILCDVDLDGNNEADVAAQYDFGCGTPSNYYIDQGHVIYEQVCGAELSVASMAGRVLNEINPETCE